MNCETAKKLLDKAREGHRFTFEQISAALYATGDLHDPVRGEGVEESLQSQDTGAGEDQSPKLVVSSQGGHHSDSWPGYSRYLDCRNEQAAT